LQISVDDAHLVSLMKCVTAVHQDRDSASWQERTFLSHRLIQIPPIKHLHDDVERTVFEFAVHEYAHGVRMRELTHRACFTPKTTHQIRAPFELRVKNLDGDFTSHLRLFSTIHRPHTPSTDPLQDAKLAIQYVSTNKRVLIIRRHLCEASYQNSLGTSPELTSQPLAWEKELRLRTMMPPKEPQAMPSPPQLTSRLREEAGFSHGFFTRQGGVSSGI